MEKIAFLFPGQGSQYVGMSKTLCEQFPVARRTFEEASDILGYDLAKLCFEGSLGELAKIENSLVAILVSSVVAFRVYMKEIGVAPQFCTGHSLGEYSALTCSGAIRFSDAVKLVYQRGLLAKAVAEQGQGAMTIIDGVGSEVVAAECQKISAPGRLVAVSCYNSMNQVAISGVAIAVQLVEERILEMGGQVTPLFGNAPFHCPLMAPAAEGLQVELGKYTYYNTRWPVILNTTVQPYEGPEKMVTVLSNQLVQPVRWHQIMNYLDNHGVTLTIEMGVKNVLSNLMKINVEGIKALCFDQKEDRQELREFFSANDLYRKHVPTVITKSMAIAVATPNQNWDEVEYQKGVVEPYRKLRQIQEELESGNADPTEAKMINALELLRLIFETKRVPIEEQREWFWQIQDETGTHYMFDDFLKMI